MAAWAEKKKNQVGKWHVLKGMLFRRLRVVNTFQKKKKLKTSKSKQ